MLLSLICFLGAGTKGMRKALPNARIMLHQPLGESASDKSWDHLFYICVTGSARGQAADIEIQAKEILFVRSVINHYLSQFTSQPLAKIAVDCDRDFFLTATQAFDYGLIDEVVKTKTSHVKLPPMQLNLN
jgi:ATP-dependent Clp protease protease subunit